MKSYDNCISKKKILSSLSLKILVRVYGSFFTDNFYGEFSTIYVVVEE